MNALDLVISQRVSDESFARAKVILQQNYGTEYSDEKFEILFEMIRDDGWTEHRFSEVLKWFLKNKRWPNWTVADWFDYSVKVYPLEWAEAKWATGLANGWQDIESYELDDGTVVYKPRDGVVLPFKRRK